MSISLAGFWAGLLAGILSTTAIYFGWFTHGIPVVALGLWERALRAIPMEVFGFFIVRLKFLAKPLAFWGMMAAVVAVYGALGALVGRWTRRPAARFAWALVLSTVPLGLVASGPASVFLLARLQAEGASSTSADVQLSIWLAVAGYSAVYAMLFTLAGLWKPASVRRTPSDAEMTRRQLLHRAVILTGGAVAGSTLARLLSAAAQGAVVYAQTLFDRIKGLPPEVTANKDFYVVSKNPPGFDPVVNVEKWTLEIAGLVSRPVKLTYDEIRAMPSVERYHTLECISNEVGGDLISNAKWRGVPLRELLAKAGDLAPKTVRIAFRCADGYTESIPIADALNPDTLLVYEMNGERLPTSHGFPARLLVPGLFGMKNPKWITKIEAVDYNFLGYWERSGWSDKAAVQTMSKFTAPRAGTTVRLGDEVELGGVAYTGDRGIKGVEFSVDDGKTWLAAELKSPLGKYTWVLWAAIWKPQAAGSYALRVRTTDGLGVRQTAADSATLPNGATGYHRIVIRARS